MRVGLRAQLLSGYLLVILSLLGLSWYGLRTTAELQANLQTVGAEVTPKIRELGGLRAATYNLLEAIASIQLSKTDNGVRGSKRLAEEQRELLDVHVQLESAKSNYRMLALTDLTQHPFYEELLSTIDQLLELSSTLSTQPSAVAAIDFFEAKERLELLERRIAAITDLALETELYNLEMQQREGLQALRRATRTQKTGLLLAALFCVVFAFLISRRILQPLRELHEATNALGQQNFKRLLALPTQRRDEIGALGRAFGTMAQQLRETTVSRGYLEGVIDSMFECMLVVDAHGVVRLANRSAAALLGQTKEALKGQAAANLYESNPQAASAALKDGKQVSTEDGFLLSSSFGRIPVRCSKAMIESSPELAGTVWVASDQREILRSQAELLDYRDRLSMAERLAAIGKLAATIAHRINQPLSAIRLCIQQAQRALPRSIDTSIQECLHDGLEQAQRAQSIVAQVLQSTRIQHSEALQEVSIAKVAAKTVSILSAQLDQAPLQIKLEKLENLPILLGREEDFEEMFFILVQNALGAAVSTRSCTLTIAGRSTEQHVELEFRDTCAGIAAEDLASIFDPFFTKKPVGIGTGLGLPILKELLQRCAGTVEVRSVLGEGSCFTLRLPHKTPQQACGSPTDTSAL